MYISIYGEVMPENEVTQHVQDSKELTLSLPSDIEDECSLIWATS